MSSHKTAISSMSNTAKSLERDPQLNQHLADRKRELGIDATIRRSLGGDLAFSHAVILSEGEGRDLTYSFGHGPAAASIDTLYSAIGSKS